LLPQAFKQLYVSMAREHDYCAWQAAAVNFRLQGGDQPRFTISMHNLFQ
jgi:hypothetical protein